MATLTSTVVRADGRIVLFYDDGTSRVVSEEELIDVSGNPLFSSSNPGTVTVAYGAAVALSSPPTVLTASADTSLTFASQVRHVFIQNNSATPVGVEFDAAASAGSTQIAAFGGVLRLHLTVTVLHVYSTAATPVNGTAGSNLIVKGWS